MKEPLGRREFLKTAARLTIAGGAVAGAAALVMRRGECRLEIACAACGKAEGCELKKVVTADGKGEARF